MCCCDVVETRLDFGLGGLAETDQSREGAWPEVVIGDSLKATIFSGQAPRTSHEAGIPAVGSGRNISDWVVLLLHTTE